MSALNALDDLIPPTAGVRDLFAGLPAEAPSIIPRLENDIPRLIDAIPGDLPAAASAPSPALR
mgnify:CR=1 FL=1